MPAGWATRGSGADGGRGVRGCRRRLRGAGPAVRVRALRGRRGRGLGLGRSGCPRLRSLGLRSGGPLLSPLDGFGGLGGRGLLLPGFALGHLDLRGLDGARGQTLVRPRPRMLGAGTASAPQAASPPSRGALVDASPGPGRASEPRRPADALPSAARSARRLPRGSRSLLRRLSDLRPSSPISSRPRPRGRLRLRPPCSRPAPASRADRPRPSGPSARLGASRLRPAGFFRGSSFDEPLRASAAWGEGSRCGLFRSGSRGPGGP